MLYSILSLALLSISALAVPNKRQISDAGQFTSAADQLISSYIPTTVLPVLESAVSSAASAASVSGVAADLLFSALAASSIPGWFQSAIPAAYSTQIGALEGDISALKATPIAVTTSTATVPVVTVITTTDSAGSTITTSSISLPTSVTAT